MNTEEGGRFIVLKEKIPNLSILALTSVSFSWWVGLFTLEDLKVEAALNVNKVLTASDQVPVDDFTRKKSIDLQKSQGWVRRYRERHFSNTISQRVNRKIALCLT
ncbi:MAG: hypothetical protein MRJ67_12280 [Nitrospirales bacterium]|nr:hypothetical protein [Nitrospirales bacterium]MDR4482508.1 hypothetical protein [Nitrospirales bacterium]